MAKQLTPGEDSGNTTTTHWTICFSNGHKACVEANPLSLRQNVNDVINILSDNSDGFCKPTLPKHGKYYVYDCKTKRVIRKITRYSIVDKLVEVTL